MSEEMAVRARTVADSVIELAASLWGESRLDEARKLVDISAYILSLAPPSPSGGES